MTHFCTSIQRHADFEICQKLPLKELIFEHQSLSRFGELETATLLEMLKAWKTNEGKAFLQWDLLHNEKSFEEDTTFVEDDLAGPGLNKTEEKIKSNLKNKNLWNSNISLSFSYSALNPSNISKTL